MLISLSKNKVKITIVFLKKISITIPYISEWSEED